MKLNSIVVLIATWFLCLTFGSARVLTTVDYPTVVYYADSNDPYVYRNKINDLYDLLKSEISSHGIPLLPIQVPITSEKRFVIVEIGSKGYHIKFALDVINANVLGFSTQDQFSYFFNDISDEIYNSQLFDQTTKAKLSFDGSYKSLENEGAFRENTTIGNPAVNEAVIQLYDYRYNKSLEIAPSLLVVIQMISEAARFQYIKNKVFENYLEGFVPKSDIISLEDEWTRLSAAVQTASENGVFSPITLLDANGKPFDVSSVSQISSKVSLLLGVCIIIEQDTGLWPFTTKAERFKNLLAMY